MVTIAELEGIRKREANLLMIETKKLQAVKKVQTEKDKLINEIRRIRKARNRDKEELKSKSRKELKKIASGAKRAGSTVIRYLQRIRDQY